MTTKFADKKNEPVNHLAVHPLTYCCGMSELGNFNYDDPPGTKQMTHYHKVGGGWSTQSKNEKHNTKEQLEAQIKYQNGGVVATTGAGQEWVEPILTEIGFKHVFTFVNPGHAATPVKVWCYSKHEVSVAPAGKGESK